MYRLVIDDDGKGYTLAVQQAEGFVVAGGNDYRLPDDASIEITKLGGALATFIDFYPNGRTDPATIRLSAQGYNDIVMTCPSPTETFSIVKEGAGQ
jgi:hypothetical protein